MFEDCQRVQNLRETLLRTLVVLDAQLEVAENCSWSVGSEWNSDTNANRHALLYELNAHSVRLRTHHKAVGTILNRSQGTLDLVSKHRLTKMYLRRPLTLQ